MENPESIGKPRWFVCWFSPLRWRFWMWISPLLAVIIISILFTWPGLSFNWEVSEQFIIRRPPPTSFEMAVVDAAGDHLGFSCLDTASLKAGPFRIEKFMLFRYEGKPLAAGRGFFLLDDSRASGLGYSLCDGSVTFSLVKDWSSVR